MAIYRLCGGAAALIGVEAVWALGSISTAIAGPWVQGRGQTYQSGSVSRDTGDLGRTWRQDVYLEYGASSDWTVVGKEEALWRDDAGVSDQRTGWQAGMRRQLVQRGGFVASAEASILFGDALEGDLCEGTGAEARLSAGYGGPLGRGRNWYVSGSSAWRERGRCNRIREEIALGADITENWIGVVKAYGEWGDGAESVKMEALIGRRIANIDMSLGYHAEVSGNFDEAGVVLHLARRF